MKHISTPAFFAGTTSRIPRALMGGGIRADASDPKAVLAELQRSFEAFKSANEEKLKGKADVVLDEKVERINAAVGDLQKIIEEQAVLIAAAKAGNGPAFGVEQTPEQIAYAKAFPKFFRKGEIQAAMSVGSAPDGGYTAPVEWDRTLGEKLKLISPIRANSSVITISGPGFSKLFTDRAVGTGWVGETAARPATSTPQIGSLPFAIGEMYANPAVTQTLLDDSYFDIEKWLADEVDVEFARQEGIAFLSGNGTNKPTGILTYVTGAANAAVHPYGAIQVVNSGAATALTTDGIITMIYALPAAYSANAKLYINRLSMSAMRKLKDGQGNYIWQPSFQQGQPATLAGVPIIDTPDIANIGAGVIAALYGDMAETYLVIDRIGIRVLRDPYTNKPYVQFYTTKRVGGGVKNPLAMIALNIST
jgi:HK97 family phage major capsid protein